MIGKGHHATVWYIAEAFQESCSTVENQIKARYLGVEKAIRVPHESESKFVMMLTHITMSSDNYHIRSQTIQ